MGGGPHLQADRRPPPRVALPRGGSALTCTPCGRGVADTGSETSLSEMRIHMLLALPLLAGPLAAQRGAIAPAPSRLFALPVVVAETGTPHQGIPKGEARVIGGIAGLLIGIGAAEAFRSLGPADGEDGGLDRGITFGLVGMVLGTLTGPLLLSE